jgi:hypothetical protein
LGEGPWYNAEGDLIAQHLAALHGVMSRLDKETAVTEAADQVNPELHEILTGSRLDGTAFTPGAQRTCGNWTSSGTGSAQVGYFDRAGPGDNPNSGTLRARQTDAARRLCISLEAVVSSIALPRTRRRRGTERHLPFHKVRRVRILGDGGNKFILADGRQCGMGNRNGEEDYQAASVDEGRYSDPQDARP